MRQEAFKEGSEFPPCQPGLIRIYSMRFCPFAERALLVANAKQIPHEVVNIDLRQKPSWFLAKNPEGQVPVLELNDQIVGESLVVSDYLDETHPQGIKLISNDPYRRARDKMLITKFGKVEMAFYANVGGLMSGDEDKTENMFKAMDWLETEISGKATPFYAGQKLGMVDLMIWPMLERIDILSSVPSDRFPNLTAWFARMKQEQVIQETCLKPELIKSFIEDFLAKKHDFDLGL